MRILQYITLACALTATCAQVSATGNKVSIKSPKNLAQEGCSTDIANMVSIDIKNAMNAPAPYHTMVENNLQNAQDKINTYLDHNQSDKSIQDAQEELHNAWQKVHSWKRTELCKRWTFRVIGIGAMCAGTYYAIKHSDYISNTLIPEYIMPWCNSIASIFSK